MNLFRGYPNRPELQGNPAEAQMSDEEMLDNVSRAMGNEGGPPPGSGMKWEDLTEDQDALVQNPSPENVQAFVQYWGEENLPPEMQQGARGRPETAAEGEY